jgi:hypothetical protein
VALQTVREAGISFRPTFVPFTPWATLDDYLTLCRFIRERELEDEVDPVQLSIRLLVPPGSLLLGTPELRPHLGALDEEALTYRWSHPDARMDHLEAAVAALVEEATAREEAPATTFARIHRLAADVAGVALDDVPARAPRPSTPPRLTEAWFCCAQPTRVQLGALRTRPVSR